jgi:hypothetical protein
MTSEQEPSTSPQDDMLDAANDFRSFPFLYTVLGECRDTLLTTYHDSNAKAIVAQDVHRWWVVVAAASATSAVVLAIIGLAWHSQALTWLEMAAVIMAFIAFTVGGKRREKWLTERHRAERCRLLKFKAVVLPEYWALSEFERGRCPTAIAAEVEEVTRLSYRDVETWLANDRLPPPPGRVIPRDMAGLDKLRDYYHEKRLGAQLSYFKRVSERDPARETFWQNLPAWLFIGSVIFVFAHGLIEIGFAWFGGDHETPAAGVAKLAVGTALVLAVFAAALPTGAAGIRTWRSAHESTRNRSRFRAKKVALLNISERLKASRIDEPFEVESLLRDLWCAEQIMESEHREWLRLMTDAEWQW